MRATNRRPCRIRLCRPLAWTGHRIEPAAFQQRFHSWFAAGEGPEKGHRLLAASPRKQGAAEVITVRAGKASVFLEPFDAVGIEHLGPDVRVVSGGVPAG